MWNDFFTIFQSVPGAYLILSPQPPDFTILAANESYLQSTQTGREIIGRGLFEVFPDNPADPKASGVKNLTDSLIKVLKTKTAHVMPIQRYDTRRPGTNEFYIRYWKPVNKPVLNKDGSLTCIIHAVQDVTDVVLLQKNLKEKDAMNQRHITDAVKTTQELERIEISQELHDNVGQILNTSRLYLEMALKSDEDRNEFLKSGHALVENAMEELKKISAALLQSSPEERDLTTALEELISHVMDLKHINVFKKIHLPDEGLIESKIKMNLIRIMQEQLTNVVKHSEAKNLFIDLTFKDHNLELTIRDDGKGFDMFNYKKGMGLQNIKTRAAMMDGRVLINSYPGDGCQISVSMPVKTTGN